MKLEESLYLVQIHLPEYKEGYWTNLEELVEIPELDRFQNVVSWKHEQHLCIYTNPKLAVERAKQCDHESRVVSLRDGKRTDGPFYKGRKKRKN